MVLFLYFNVKFIIQWLYLFLRKFKFRNHMLQILLQILASLSLQRYQNKFSDELDQIDNEKESEIDNVIESSHKDVRKEIKIIKNDKPNNLSSKSHSQISRKNKKYLINDGKAIFIPNFQINILQHAINLNQSLVFLINV